MKVSVVIPVLNERRCLPQNLAALKLNHWIHEIIIVDGGSKDGTLAWLREQSGVKLIESPAGRGIQLNAGARVATGDTLLFLHADTRLPPNAAEQLKGSLDSSQVVGGCFGVRFDHQRPRSLGIVAAGINLRTVLTRSATGDQAIFVPRSVFEKIGGFRDWPLFEDVDFVRRMKQVGKFAVIRSPVIVSARRHVHYGVFRTVTLVYLLRLGFWAGISPFTLARWYQRPGAYPEARRTLAGLARIVQKGLRYAMIRFSHV
jgi:rSAM/selenodomain-associated transferase 2